jgi:hypothetical protein
MKFSNSLLDVMFRDGLLYFTAVAGVNIMNVIIYFVRSLRSYVLLVRS